MSSGSGKRRKGTRSLNNEDQALWQAFSKTVKPLSGQKHIGKKAETTKPDSDSRETKTSAEHKSNSPKQVISPTQSTKNRPAVSVKPAPGLSDFDDKKIRRLNSGRLKVEALLDLHGMRQNEALAELRRFLGASANKDYRTVLIITGKGFARSDDEREWFDRSDRERGILRRMLPNWLEQPEFRSIVVSYTSAGPRHGGDGAFYVQLRSRRRRS